MEADVAVSGLDSITLAYVFGLIALLLLLYAYGRKLTWRFLPGLAKRIWRGKMSRKERVERLKKHLATELIKVCYKAEKKGLMDDSERRWVFVSLANSCPVFEYLPRHEASRKAHRKLHPYLLTRLKEAIKGRLMLYRDGQDPPVKFPPFTQERTVTKKLMTKHIPLPGKVFRMSH